MYFCGLVIVCVRRRVSVRAMKTVSCKVMVRSEMRRMGDGYWIEGAPKIIVSWVSIRWTVAR